MTEHTRMTSKNSHWYQRWISRHYKWMATLVPVWDTDCPDRLRHDAYGQLGRDPKTGKLFSGIYGRNVRQFIATYGLSEEI